MGGKAPLTASGDGFCALFTNMRATKEHLWLNTGMSTGPGAAPMDQTVDIHVLAHDFAAHDDVINRRGDGQHADHHNRVGNIDYYRQQWADRQCVP